METDNKQLRKFIRESIEVFMEDITIPINVGDEVLGGRFKNKKIIVKDIGENEKGDITINGKPLLKFRIKKESFSPLNEDTFNEVLNSKIGTVLSENDIYSYCQKMHRNESDFWEGDIGERIEGFPYYKLMEIPIDKIDTDEWELDDDYKDEYIEKFKSSVNYPPIVLGEIYYGKYTIIDGNHRANALKDSGVKIIKSWIGIKKL